MKHIEIQNSKATELGYIDLEIFIREPYDPEALWIGSYLFRNVPVKLREHPLSTFRYECLIGNLEWLSSL